MDTTTHPSTPGAPDRAVQAATRVDRGSQPDLRLLSDDQPDWRLSEATREAGRRGIASARAALGEARRRAAARDTGSTGPGHASAA